MIAKICNSFKLWRNNRIVCQKRASMLSDYMIGMGQRQFVNNGFGVFNNRDRDAKPLWNKKISLKRATAKKKR